MKSSVLRVARTFARVDQLPTSSDDFIAYVRVECPNILSEVGANDGNMVWILVQIATQRKISM